MAGRARRSLVVTVTDARGRPAGMGALARWLARAAPARARGSVTIALVSDAAMRRLNRTYRRADYATDVLSFPVERVASRGRRTDLPPSQMLRRTRRSLGGGGQVRLAPGLKARPTYGRDRVSSVPLGDIAIATGVARRQARAHGHDAGVELRVLALHGLLHLLGYDHETDTGQMARVEDRLRRKGGLPPGLIGRAPRAASR